MNDSSGIIAKLTKNKKRLAIISGCVAAVIIIAIILASTIRPSSGAMPSAYQQTTVQTGSITNTVTGSGTLQYGDATDVKVPSGIKIDEVLVESGDYVEAGQALATVNTASVQSNPRVRLQQPESNLSRDNCVRPSGYPLFETASCPR